MGRQLRSTHLSVVDRVYRKMWNWLLTGVHSSVLLKGSARGCIQSKSGKRRARGSVANASRRQSSSHGSTFSYETRYPPSDRSGRNGSHDRKYLRQRTTLCWRTTSTPRKQN